MLYREEKRATGLAQRFLGKRQFFQIEEEWLQVEIRTLFSTTNHAIPYEEIGGFRVRTQWHSKKAIGIGLGLLAVSLTLALSALGTQEGYDAALGYGVLGGAALLVYLLTYHNVTGLTFPNQSAAAKALRPVFLQPVFGNGTPLVEEFIAQLLRQRDAYLLARYGQLTSLVDYSTQLQNLTHLNRAGVLSNQEFLIRRAQLEKLLQRPQGPLGFELNYN